MILDKRWNEERNTWGTKGAYVWSLGYGNSW